MNRLEKYGIGQPVTRKEDDRLTAGRGCYADDVQLVDQAYGYVLRSPHAHAEIAAMDVEAARAMPGVLRVLSGSDVDVAGLGHIPCYRAPRNRDGSDAEIPPNPLLKKDKVRFVGDPVAFVVADTPDQACDAAERIVVVYRPLAAVVDTESACNGRQPVIWNHAPDNVAVDCEAGDRTATDAAFTAAAHVARLSLVNNRVVVAAMEPRAAIGSYDSASGRYTLHTTSQTSHFIRDVLAKTIFDIPADDVRVITRDVGGGFGMKVFFAEYALVLWASKLIGRPVKWAATRRESFVCDSQGRDHVTRAELALDDDGRFLAIRVDIIANMGAYLGTFGPHVPVKLIYTGVYDVPAVHLRVRDVFTNTVPTDAYRGAGRPEATYVIERLVEIAARDLGVDAVELRRRNYVPPTAMPYTTPFGMVYDSGEFARNMDDALSRADAATFASRRAAARRDGSRRGIGLAYYIDTTGGPVVATEDATIRFEDDDTVTVLSACQASGQGHETAYSQLVTDRLGVSFDRVNVHQGDTDEIPLGYGTGGSRSLMDGGGAILCAIDAVVENGRETAAHELEVSASDLEFADGNYVVTGTDRRIALTEVARSASRAGERLVGIGSFVPQAVSYPNGCHICEVEVDIETGRLTVERYTVVDDFGNVVNPLLVEGQVHGGVVQGIGQALWELAAYDGASGQLLTGTFMDYGMPRASGLPMFDATWNEIPCLTNPLGVKGAAEGGTVGALAAVVNAVVDALAEFGVTHIDMPMTPETVWRAIHRNDAKPADDDAGQTRGAR